MAEVHPRVFVTNTPCPGGWWAEYFDNNNLTDRVHQGCDDSLDFYWGNSSPGHGVGADTFSVRWRAWFWAARRGRYTFGAAVDDGVRIRVADEAGDSSLVVDQWGRSGGVGAPLEGDIDLERGWYALQVEMREGSGGAGCRLFVTPPAGTRRLLYGTELMGGSGLVPLQQ